MERVNQLLQRLFGNEGFRRRYEQMRRYILTHPDVQPFLQAHEQQLSRDAVDRSLMKLYEFIEQHGHCRQCPGLEQCPNMLPGYHPNLVVAGGRIDVEYDRCPKKVQDDERRRQEALIQSMFVPREILQASLSDVDLSDDGRIKAIQFAEKFVTEYEPGKKMKGLYLYGSFGVGKTYLLGAIANELAKRNIPSLIVYVPELFRELKHSLQDQTMNEKLDYVKKVPVLMLDDLGAEAMSSWVRDDVLGPILQYRMFENLPTFFTSNFDMKQLAHHLTYSQRGEEEKVKAARIMERIRSLAHPVEITGPNRRE
ncbi:primosomal protein DnaI [Geobacillus sp. FSL K6-0789]|uniref:Primosomal protein DnaI n=2 Tax=Geobacillus TaxID=129337 RepID=A0A087LCV4_GEOSE|nr:MULTISPECIES: primosomal protein DnaI [Geobacillus]AKM20027.1 Primosomal protein DnaI [Geobacillus sp. 12AMOR1]AKU26021.1 primosomal protein DnaI [Geobacillus sp. LC300]ASS86795.1 primosomal protein DnaI [Geobacillus lituanicus]MED0654368.1 primosomal protein DnaI [Anoxybacillus geothermalis]STO13323.1 Primosomal protein DnaI [[Flavobacterium] thermophilum]